MRERSEKVLSNEVSVLNGKAVCNQECLHRLFRIVQVNCGGLHDVRTGIIGIESQLDDGGLNTGDVVIGSHTTRGGGRIIIIAAAVIVSVIVIGIIAGR